MPFQKEKFIQLYHQEGEDDEDTQLQIENTIRWRINPMNPV